MSPVASQRLYLHVIRALASYRNRGNRQQGSGEAPGVEIVLNLTQTGPRLRGRFR